MTHSTRPLTLSVPPPYVAEMDALLGKQGRVFPSQQMTACRLWPRVTWVLNRHKLADIHTRAVALAANLRDRMTTLEVYATDEGAKVLGEVAGSPGRAVGIMPDGRGLIWAFVTPRDRLVPLQALATLLADDPTQR